MQVNGEEDVQPQLSRKEGASKRDSIIAFNGGYDQNKDIMAKKTSPLLPATDRLLHAFAERLRLARLRRKLTARQVAERAGMTPATLRNLERGNAGVTMGAYLAVMQVLGIETDLAYLAAADAHGRQLQDARLRRTRGSQRKAADLPDTELSISDMSAPAAAAFRVSEPDWIAEGDFASADALAALITEPRPKRKPPS